jgi:putative Holliday junction resolvase
MKRVMPERRVSGQAGATQPPQSRLSASERDSTVLAFDFGERRTGVAVGDARLRTAHPLQPIAAIGAARFRAIGALLAEWRPGRLVVGWPVSDNGRPHPLAPRVERFARQLEDRYGIQVVRVDERYTSTAAESRMREAAGARRTAKAGRARQLDSYAAQLILAQYFDEAAT